MEIQCNEIKEMTIEEFADANNLIMEVHERRTDIKDNARFYAHFKKCEVQEDGMLIGTYGNGNTQEAAIAAYALKIHLKTIVIDAYGADRQVIAVPRIKVL